MIPEGEVVVFTDRNGLFMPVPANCPFTPAPATSSTQRGERGKNEKKDPLLEEKRELLAMKKREESVRNVIIIAAIVIFGMLALAIFMSWNHITTFNMLALVVSAMELGVILTCIYAKQHLKHATGLSLVMVVTFVLGHFIYHYQDLITKPVFSNMLFLFIDGCLLLMFFLQFINVCHFKRSL